MASPNKAEATPRYVQIGSPWQMDAYIASSMYTASFAFFEALWEAGVAHVFVNLGSDHPVSVKNVK
jgi:hypothetical protein